MSLTIRGGLSPLIMIVIILAAMVTFLALVMATKIITGEENIIYYHHEIAVMMVAVLLLWLLKQPVLAYLDFTILGIGIFLVCGRVGCLMVGCCHGRPNNWGVCYRPEHADAGFTYYYVGIRLLPIQAIESLWVLCVVIVGVMLILNGYPPGAALAWYVMAYDVGRFCFEFARGDPERPYLWGFSQGQWLSVALMFFVMIVGLYGALPFYSWHAWVTSCLLLVMTAVAVRRRLAPGAKHRLLNPIHVREVASVVENVSALTTEIPPAYRLVELSGQTYIATELHLGCTSLGVQISASEIGSAADRTLHYALSYRDGDMPEEAARIIAGLILQLRQSTEYGELLRGTEDVFHLLIHPLARKALTQ
ncbi:MAG: prolipoprotein diacylglyceryl transferase [Blastocatellia bacterium]